MNLSNGDKCWLIGAALCSCAVGADVGGAAAVGTFGLSVMALGFVKGYINIITS